MSSPSAQSVTIIGGGLTGLSAAWVLRDADVDVAVCEAASVAGGHAVTVAESGYRFDRTGHLLHLKSAEARREVMDLLGGEALLVRRRSMVWSHGVYTRYPFQANVYGLPKDVAFACVMDFLQAQQGKPASLDASFEDFCRATFGDAMTDVFMVPYNQKLWGVSPSEISSAWCQRFVPRPSVADVIAGAVGLNDRELGYNTEFLYPRLGIGQLSDAMAARVADVLQLDSPIEAVEFGERRVRVHGQWRNFDALISTAPLRRLIELSTDAPGNVRAAAALLRCSSLVYLDVALKKRCKTDHHWVYVPDPKVPFYRVGCYSHFSNAMAPDGCSSLYVELASRDERDADELMLEVTPHLVSMGMIDGPHDIAFARTRRLEHAYVIYDRHYTDARKCVLDYLANVGVISAGRYGDWNYSSMGDAIEFGRAAAGQALELLGGSPAGDTA